MKNNFIKTVGLLALLIVACGGSTEEEIAATKTQVAAALFETQTASAPTLIPTKTSTPVPTPTYTPEPSPTIDPESNIPFTNPYFPLAENFTWWYLNIDADENLNFSNFSLWFVDENDLGIEYYTFVTQNTAFKNILDIYLSDETGLGIVYTITSYPDGTIEEFAIEPFLPIMILPLEDGNTWEMEITLGESIVLAGFMATYHPTLELVTTSFEDCYEITYLDGGENGDPYYKEYYCIDLGKIGYAFYVGSEWDLYELIFFTNGRVTWDSFVSEDDGCAFTFSVYGFESGETFGLTFYQVPNFSEPVNQWSGFNADDPLEFTFTSDLPNGTYVLDFIGEEGSSASFMADWTGSCPE